jgi:uncharacterized protein (DUF697 family)
MDQLMTDQSEPSPAVTLMMHALDWVWDQATAPPIPGLGSAEELANTYREMWGDPEKAIEDLIRWQILLAGTVGFASNVGGLITMPFTLPADIMGVLWLQLRMIAAIAHLRGYNIKDEHVKTVAFICLTGSSTVTILKDVGLNLGTKLSARAIAQISSVTLTKINQAVGFRLITKTGTTGVINITKWVPFVGGVVGGSLDATVTGAVSLAAKSIFEPIFDNKARIA